MDILLSLFGFLSGMRRLINFCGTVQYRFMGRTSRKAIGLSSGGAVSLPYLYLPHVSRLPALLLAISKFPCEACRQLSLEDGPTPRLHGVALGTPRFLLRRAIPVKLKAGDVFIASAVQKINHISSRSCLQVLDFMRRLEIVDTATRLHVLTMDCSRWWKSLCSWCSYPPPPGELSEVDSMQVSTGRAVLYSIPVVSYQACGYTAQSMSSQFVTGYGW